MSNAKSRIACDNHKQAVQVMSTVIHSGRKGMAFIWIEDDKDIVLDETASNDINKSHIEGIVMALRAVYLAGNPLKI